MMEKRQSTTFSGEDSEKESDVNGNDGNYYGYIDDNDIDD